MLNIEAGRRGSAGWVRVGAGVHLNDLKNKIGKNILRGSLRGAGWGTVVSENFVSNVAQATFKTKIVEFLARAI